MASPRRPPEPPSGAQHRLRRADQEAWITEVGATLRSYRAGTRELLDGFGEDERCTGGRGQLLLPWPNRIRDGRYHFAGRDHQLALTEPAAGHAIHGLARWRNWTRVSGGEGHVTLGCTLHAEPGYPFVVALEATYRLGEEGVAVTLAATNVGTVPCPYGAGAHPYVRLDTDRVDDLELTVPAATRYVTDDRSIPVGTEPVDGTEADFRHGRRIGDTRLDTALRDLARDDDGRARVRLRSPSGAALTVWLGEGFDHLMLFTGDSLEDAARRRRGLGVEPMTCPPDAFHHDGTYRVLDPGERTEATFGIAPG